MKRVFLRAVGFAALSLVPACAPAATAPVADARATAHASTPAPAADEWSTSSWEERHDVMTWGVLPSMARAFQHQSKSDAPTLTCRSCHGADAEARRYAMPSPTLRPIDPQHLPAPSPMVSFMTTEVVPQMRNILGSPTLSCNGCHPTGGAR